MNWPHLTWQVLLLLRKSKPNSFILKMLNPSPTAKDRAFKYYEESPNELGKEPEVGRPTSFGGGGGGELPGGSFL